MSLENSNFNRKPLLEKGSMVDSWKVMESGGIGGMGSTYVVENTDAALRDVGGDIIDPGKTYLMKLPKFPARQGEDYSREIQQITTDFANEMNILTLLRSSWPDAAKEKIPYFTKILTRGIYDDGSLVRPYFVMETATGGTLSEKSSPLRANEAYSQALLEMIRVMSQDMGKALYYIHKLGIAHLDLKPTNIFLQNAMQWMLGDFGISITNAVSANDTKSLIQPTIPRGTMGYAPFETYQGLPVTQTDVYGFAASIYATAGDGEPPPFHANERKSLVELREKQEVTAYMNAFAALDGVIGEGLAWEPENRPDPLHFAERVREELDKGMAIDKIQRVVSIPNVILMESGEKSAEIIEPQLSAGVNDAITQAAFSASASTVSEHDMSTIPDFRGAPDVLNELSINDNLLESINKNELQQAIAYAEKSEREGTFTKEIKKDILAWVGNIIKHDPLNTRAILFQGNLLYKLAKDTKFFSRRIYQKAEKALDIVISLEPRNNYALITRGTVSFEQKKFEEAQHFFEQATINDPRDHNAHYSLGRVYMKLGYVERALECYEIAIGLSPNFIEAVHSNAEALETLGAYERALTVYEKLDYKKFPAYELRKKMEKRKWQLQRQFYVVQ